MLSGINESNILTKHTSYEFKCKFDGRKCNSNQKWIMTNVDTSVKNVIYVQKIIFGILLHVVAKILNILQVFLMMLK